jgi:hypothetical protein
MSPISRVNLAAENSFRYLYQKEREKTAFYYQSKAEPRSAQNCAPIL